MSTRKPRAILRVDGAEVPLVEWSAHVTRLAQADTFSGSGPLNGAPLGIDYWSNVGPVRASLLACNDEGEGYIELVKGWIDAAEVEISDKGFILRVSGRDRTAELIDSKRTQKDPNKKASEIVSEIAGKHGLSLDIDATDDFAGKQHLDETAHLIDADTDWNTLTRLAEREGAFLYLKGDTLYFKLPGSDSGEGSYSIHVQPPEPGIPADADVRRIRFQKNAHLAGGMKQTVRSAHTRKAKNIVKTETVGDAEANRALTWVDQIPGLTDAQAEKVAKKLIEEKARHQVTVEYDGPGDVNIDPRQMLQISGPVGAFAQSYFIDSIDHRGSQEDGYSMSVRAKNKAGGSE